jgi:hypothetical protein
MPVGYGVGGADDPGVAVAGGEEVGSIVGVAVGSAEGEGVGEGVGFGVAAVPLVANSRIAAP